MMDAVKGKEGRGKGESEAFLPRRLAQPLCARFTQTRSASRRIDSPDTFAVAVPLSPSPFPLPRASAAGARP